MTYAVGFDGVTPNTKLRNAVVAARLTTKPIAKPRATSFTE